MCDPVTLTSLALTAGSVAANSIAQGQVNSARNSAFRAETSRQAGYDAQNKALTDANRAQYDQFGANQQQTANQLGSYFRSAAPAQTDTGAGTANTAAAKTVPGATNDIVTREMDKQAAQAKAYSDQQGSALGTLRSFGDTMGDASRTQGLNSTLIGQINGFKAGSAGVLPFELEQANSKGAGWQLLGDLLGGVSGVVGPAAYAGKLPWLTGAAPLAPTAAAGMPMTAMGGGPLMAPSLTGTSALGALY